MVPLRKGRSSRWRTCPHSLTERRVVREHRSGDGAVQAFEGVPLVGLAQGSARAPYAYARMDRRRYRRGPLCVRLASTAPGRRSRTGIWPPASHLRRHMHSIRHGPGAHRSCETPWRGACTGGLRRRGPFWAGVVLSVLVRSAVRNTAEPWIWLGPSEVARPGVRNAEWGDAPDGVGSIFSINHARHPCAATLPPTHADQISAGQEDQEGRRIGR